eukprot:TRINITY_DN17753_c0_g1_i1.p1 TRINITY_DN17753_c0_g1~~TRINITY_DN17753_c0_g1_i1.p1  ORF type:complete len:580 (+),score=63.13 TRINITY_DN17753_c0_g1_i1:76-1815(+)
MAAIHWRTAAFLGLIWMGNLLYFENLVFMFSKCQWPDLPYGGEGDNSLGRPSRLALIADPHLTGSYSYFQQGSPLVRLKQFYSDLYMRRAFRLSVLPSMPDTVVVLGNTLDEDLTLSPDGWFSIVERYKHIFDQKRPGLSRSGSGVRLVPIHTLYSDSIHRQLSDSLTFEAGQHAALEWLHDELGPQMLNFTLGGAEIVAINPKFLDGGEGTDLASQMTSFLADLAADNNPLPRVLLTPVPLSRANRTSSCLRRYLSHAHQVTSQSSEDSATIPSNSKAATENVTQSLLDRLKPVHVFSGHDHRVCTIQHPTVEGSLVENTLGSFSGLDFATRPSFTMVSIAPAPPHGRLSRGSVLASESCMLPSPINIYLWYIVLYILSLFAMVFPPFATIALVWAAVRQVWVVAFKREKLKNEDSPEEFDVMFDVEGAMHLVRKVESSIPVASGTDQGQSSDRKGSAVVSRTTAKRQGGDEEIDVPTAASVFAGQRVPLMSPAGTPMPMDPEKGGRSIGRESFKGRSTGGKGDSSANSSASSGASDAFWRYLRKGPWRGAVVPFLALTGIEFSFYMILVLKDWAKDV